MGLPHGDLAEVRGPERTEQEAAADERQECAGPHVVATMRRLWAGLSIESHAAVGAVIGLPCAGRAAMWTEPGRIHLAIVRRTLANASGHKAGSANARSRRFLGPDL